MAKFHLPTIEEEQLRAWEEKAVFKRVLDRNKDASRPSFTFFEGPPTANGKPGIHHLLTRSFKDVILRHRTMKGFRIDRKAGWDTHGLPVELEVEKQLGFTKKQDIEAYGIAKFNAECKKSVWKYLDLWEKSTRRVAFWVDLADPYVTYKNDFVESLWWIMKEVDKKGLLYRGYRVTPHCPRCVTSLSSHELAQGYKDTEDPSVYVKFPLRNEEKKFFLVWTTTPWTLPGNVALAVGHDITYAEVKMTASDESFILAKDLLSKLDGEFEVVAEYDGSSLIGQAYAPLYATLPEEHERAANAHKVCAADFVSTTDGTGIVHIAPAFGEDDARLGESAKLPTLLTVDNTGMVTADVPGKGRFFKKADDDVKADLTERGLLHKSETYLHSYPFCWRCSTPLLYYAKSSWYVRMSELRENLQKNNAQVNWVPSHIKDGRFGEWLREVKDWAISRERYWGTPLPVWHCKDCKTKRVIGSMDEMEASRRPANTYFLQRHGEAETNATDTLSSWPEKRAFSLTEDGREQVRDAAKKLKEKGVQRIYSSDLVRTKETAEIIAKELGLEITYDERLRELDFGDFNGKSVAEFHAAAAGLDRFEEKVGGSGETLYDVRRRVTSFMKDVEAECFGMNVVIVSHGDPLWMLRTAYRGLTKEQIKASPLMNGVGEFVEFAAPKNLPYDELGEVDVHRPFIDDVRLLCECGGEMRRVTDVMDVWFDSGAMPFAQWHYPFENAERIDAGGNFPADYISEAIDQTRGWFYTLLAVSTLLGKETSPYKNVICLGHVLDAKGQKMSKSKGNVVDPFVAIDKYGADVIRYYFFTVNQPGDAKRFDEKAVDEVVKKVFLILWNVLTYYKMYAGEGAVRAESPSPKHVLDRWILAELSALTAKVSGGLDAYDVVDSGRAIGDFVNDLSTWYVRRSRDRFKSGTSEEKAEAVATLGFTLRTLSKIMAPFTPFLADALYKEVGGGEDSVHLDAWPSLDAADEKLRERMSDVRRIASLGLEQRAAAGIAVRQALASATAHSATPLEEWQKAVIAEELNVHETKWAKADAVSVELDTVLTPELKREGAARDLVRNLNDLRKTSGLTIQDRIVIRYETESAFWNAVLEECGKEVMADTLADEIVRGKVDIAESKEVTFDGEGLWIGILKGAPESKAGASHDENKKVSSPRNEREV